MSGMHPWVLVSPAVFAGATLSLVCLALHLEIAPGALAGQESLRQDAYGRFLQMMESGVRNSFVNRDFKISWTGVRDGALVDVHISKGGRDAIDAAVQARRDGQAAPPRTPDANEEEVQEIHAATANLRRNLAGNSLVFDLQDVTHVVQQGDRLFPSRMASWTFEAPVSRLLDLRAGLPNRRALSYVDLLFRVHRWGDRNETGRLAAAEAWSRIALGFAPLCFALCAVPLALLVGKGSRGTAAVLGLGVAIVFFALWEVGGVLAGKGSLPAAPASLGGNVVLAITGLVLLRAVGRR
jgi:lipopolysaccharide export LptBFGC system permease protein LptF